jgi:outer membrane protein TolC
VLCIGLAGCTVGPDYQSPELKDEPRRSALNGESVPSRTVEGAVDIVWWKSFRDFQLSSLVERLVAQNLDLETAAESVIQSMAQRRVAASQGLPQIDGQSSSTSPSPLSAHQRPASVQLPLTLQLPFMQVSESMGNHDSKIVDAASVD